MSSHATKSCCAHKKGGNEKNCQGFHLSFFKTTGQFVNDIGPELIKLNQLPFTVFTSIFTDLFFKVDGNLNVNYVFHPPPFRPKKPIFILDRSFLI